MSVDLGKAFHVTQSDHGGVSLRFVHICICAFIELWYKDELLNNNNKKGKKDEWKEGRKIKNEKRKKHRMNKEN